MSGTAAAIASSLAFWPGLFLVAGGWGKAQEVRHKHGGKHSVLARLIPSWLGLREVLRVAAGAELIVGVLVLSGLVVPWPEALAALLLLAATGVAAWGLRNAPGADCGCFGAIVAARLTKLTVIRAGGLALLAAVAAVGGESWWSSVFHHPVTLLVLLVTGAVLAWLTPELWSGDPTLRERITERSAQFAVRMERRRVKACERRDVPVDRSVERLRKSQLWGRAKPYVSAEEPIEHWEEGCSRFICYPAVYDGEPATAVFSVSLDRSLRPSAVAFVNEEDQRILARFEADERSTNGAAASTA